MLSWSVYIAAWAGEHLRAVMVEGQGTFATPVRALRLSYADQNHKPIDYLSYRMGV